MTAINACVCHAREIRCGSSQVPVLEQLRHMGGKRVRAIRPSHGIPATKSASLVPHSLPLVGIVGTPPSQVDTSHAIQVLADYIGAQENPSVTWLQNTIKTNPKANTLLKAVIVNELIEYPRDIVAIAATPSIARALGRAPPKANS